MLSGKLLCVLLALQFCSTNSSAEYITVSSGDNAFLPCPLLFNYSDIKRVDIKWIKDKDGNSSLCKYSIDINRTDAPECRPRFKVNTDPLGLNITGVESRDAGLYTCLMSKVVPPPADEKSSTMTLKVISLTLQLMNSTNLPCVELLCSVQGLRPQQVNFTWTRATQLLHHHDTSRMSSRLTLCKPNWTDGEALTCHVSYSRNHMFYKKIILPFNSEGYNVEASWLIIPVISACAGLLLLVMLGVAICKCKKRVPANETIVYRNKIYENFTFSTAPINPTSRSQNAQPDANSCISSTPRSNPRIIRQTQRDECVYEN